MGNGDGEEFSPTVNGDRNRGNFGSVGQKVTFPQSREKKRGLVNTNKDT